MSTVAATISHTQLFEEVASLDPSRKDAVIESLSRGERGALIGSSKCAAGKKKKLSHRQQRLCQSALEKVRAGAKKSVATITRGDDRRSILGRFKRFRRKLMGKIAAFLGFATVANTKRLMRQAVVAMSSAKSSLGAKKPMPEKQLRVLLKEAQIQVESGKRANLKEMLESKGYPPVIEGANFRGADSFKGLNLEGLTFKACSFDWVHFSGSQMKNVTFESCDLLNSAFLGTKVEGCEFRNCKLQEVLFTGAKLSNVEFISSSLNGCSFEDGEVKNCKFDKVIMPFTKFFRAYIENTSILSSNLENMFFFGTEKGFTIDESSKETIPDLSLVPRSVYKIFDHNGGISSWKN